MTRAAVILGFVLGLTSLAGGILGYLRAGSVPSLAAGGGAGLLLLIAAWGSSGRRMWAQVLLLVVSFGLLARFVPAYFVAPRVWPALVIIALAMVTFGLGLLGLVLDRYRPSGGPGSL